MYLRTKRYRIVDPSWSGEEKRMSKNRFRRAEIEELERQNVELMRLVDLSNDSISRLKDIFRDTWEEK